MKILTLVWSVGIGGTERAAVNYAVGYKQEGLDSRVLVLGEGHERYPDLQEAGVETILLTKSSKKPDQVFSEFKLWSPDIIHIHNYNDSLLPYINCLKSDNTKVVETNVFSRPNFSPGYQVVDLSMQLSAWGYWKYRRWMHRAAYCPQVAIVPYIVDGSKFMAPSENEIASFLQLHKIPPDAFVIGRLGQPHPSKWDIRLVEVIKRTIHPENNIYYLLTGAPGNLIDSFNAQNDFFKSRVINIDKIEGDANLSLFYHSLNCFAHISKIGESFGYVLAESLLCKIPVITMLTPLKDNAQFEVVGHGFGGFCVTDTNEFVEAVKKLYNNNSLSESIQNNLSNWVKKRFSPGVVIPRQIGLYKKLLSGEQLPVEEVNNVIKGNIKLYKNRAWLISGYTKLVNSPFFYKVFAGLYNRIKSA